MLDWSSPALDRERLGAEREDSPSDTDLQATGRMPLAFRRGRAGVEGQLLDGFLARYPYSVSTGCRLTILREPRLDSGFPDAVAVVWDPRVASRWPAARGALKTEDLRVAQLLNGYGAVTKADLEKLTRRRVDPVLERLLAAEVVGARRDGTWRLRPLREVFALRDIIAIEAKVTHWRAVVEQATRNTWFASRSYVLLPRAPKDKNAAAEAVSRGIGIWTVPSNTPRLIAGARRHSLPRSYASWLFNEWVWRDAVSEA
jgi:hypothetical protein